MEKHNNLSSKELRIVFMGTPDFAVASLEALINAGKNIVGVITAPDRKSGRGQKVSSSSVKIFAVEKGLNVLQPTNLKSEEFIQELLDLKADLQIVVAFRMLPEIVWNMPRLGTFNLHGSLLPLYRGAAPINWAIINQEKETGVTTFFLKHKIDTGDIILQEKIEISKNDNAGVIHDKLMLIGAELVVKTVNQIEQNNYQLKPQNADSIDPKRLEAPKIFKEDCLIDWSLDIYSIHAFIRGLSPYPAAWTKIRQTESEKIYSFKILKCNIVSGAKSDFKIYSEHKNMFISGDFGTLELLEIQIEGKRKMTVKELLNGLNINDYEMV